MFKKLFISLLILTALSSEGIINLPVNIYNFYMSPGSGAEYTSGAGLDTQELQPAKNYDSIRFMGGLEEGFTLTTNSLQTFNAKKIIEDKNYENNFCCSFTPIKSTDFYSTDSKCGILQMSDNSPPYLML
jgi:hypothetical protein